MSRDQWLHAVVIDLVCFDLYVYKLKTRVHIHDFGFYNNPALYTVVFKGMASPVHTFPQSTEVGNPCHNLSQCLFVINHQSYEGHPSIQPVLNY